MVMNLTKMDDGDIIEAISELSGEELKHAIATALAVVRDRERAKWNAPLTTTDQATRQVALGIYLNSDGGKLPVPTHPGQWAKVREIEKYLWEGITRA